MKKTPLIVVLTIAVLGGAVAYFSLSNGKVQTAPKTEVAKGPDAPMTDAERLAYIKAHVSISDLTLSPDTKPDSEEVVPGLYAVRGKVTNSGARKVERVNLAVYPQDAAGKVIGSYIENIAGHEGLEPGGNREFKFLVPEKKEYGGSFDHELR